MLAWILASIKQIDRGKTRSSSVVVRAGIFALCPSEPTAVEQFLHLFIGNRFLTVSYVYVVMQSSWMSKISMFICEIFVTLIANITWLRIRTVEYSHSVYGLFAVSGDGGNLCPLWWMILRSVLKARLEGKCFDVLFLTLICVNNYFKTEKS